jgi:hypothetical protein
MNNEVRLQEQPSQLPRTLTSLIPEELPLGGSVLPRAVYVSAFKEAEPVPVTWEGSRVGWARVDESDPEFPCVLIELDPVEGS